MLLRIFATILLLLSTRSVFAQPVSAAIGLAIQAQKGTVPTPAWARKNLSAAELAPSRYRMTATFGPTQLAQKTTNQYSTYTTYMYVIPVPTQINDISVSLANPYSTAGGAVINSVSAWASDSYAAYPYIPSTWNTNSSQVQMFPTTNSVYLQCTTTISSVTVTCSSTSTIPTGGGTIFVFGPGIVMTYPVTTATITNGTTVTLNQAATASGTVTLQFCNYANNTTATYPEGKIYWDNQGADSDYVNLSGTARAFTIQPNPSSANSNPQVFTLQHSDFVPLGSIPQAASGNNGSHLLFVYVTLTGSTTSIMQAAMGGATGLGNYDTNVASGLGGFYYLEGQAYGAGDVSDNPASTGWKGASYNPFIRIDAHVDAPVRNVIAVGDSISCAPPDDNFSSWMFRASWLLSTPAAPISFSNYCWGGQASPIYFEVLRRNVEPDIASAIVCQPISRNDGITLWDFQMLAGKCEGFADQQHARIGFWGAIPFTYSLDGQPTLQNYVATMRTHLAALSTTCQPTSSGAAGQTCPKIPVMDPVPYLSRAATLNPNYTGSGNFWDYLSAGSTSTSAAAAGSTTITTNATNFYYCLPGDNLQDTTTPSAINGGNTAVVSATTTTVTVSSSAIVGSGILAGDVLECSAPGYSLTAPILTFDNTHPWYNAQAILTGTLAAPGPGLTMMEQLLGLQ